MSATDTSAAQDPFAEPRALIDALLESRLSDEQYRRLEQLLLERAEVVQIYIEYVHQHYRVAQYATTHNGVDLLREVSAKVSTADAGLADTMCLPAIVENAQPHHGDWPAEPLIANTPPTLPHRTSRLPALRWWAAAAAALLLAAIGLWMGWPTATPRHQPTSVALVATLASSVDARFSNDLPKVLHGQRLSTGALELESGAARIVLDGGAEVIVHGPARFELTSPAALSLSQGMLTAHVEHRATGFTVLTPAASLVDLGTEFGVLVTPSGATETHVLRGQVRLEPSTAGSHPINLVEHEAARVDPNSSRITNIAVRPGAFIHELPLIDLTSIVAGGNGTDHRRGGGINVVDGSRKTSAPPLGKYDLDGDGTLHAVGGSPMIASVFVPLGGKTPSVLDPAGHSFAGFPETHGKSWFWLWAGGPVPYENDAQATYRPSVIGGQDYGRTGHGVLFMHASKGITFDLAAIRAAHPGATWTRFCAVGQNTAGAAHVSGISGKSDLWVFVDGALRFQRTPVLLSDPPFDVRVELSSNDRYLTIVTTDGGDDYHGDFISLGDPRLE